MLPAELVEALRRAAEEKRQTYSVVAEEWLLAGQAVKCSAVKAKR
ncbi:MAG: hypothetical protein ABSB49_15385 [Polyangia bacterium]|jgi:hypothetical protein